MKLLYLTITIVFLLSTKNFAQDSIKTYSINEVVITASRMQLPLKNIPQKVEIIDQSLIAAIPNQNLGEILKRTINLDVIQYPGIMTTIGMRGFSPTANARNYSLLLIDGLPAGTNNLETVPSDFIEKIEVIKGSYSVLYGSDAMGGIVNIITKKNSKDITGRVGFSIGSFGQVNYNGYVSGGISSRMLFSMGYFRRTQTSDYRIGSHNLLRITDTEKNILDKKSYGDIMTNSKYQINQFNGKLEYLINNKWNAKVFSTLVTSNDVEVTGNYWHSYGLTKKDINRITNYIELKYKETNNELVISPYLSVQDESNYDNSTDSAFIDSKEKIKQYGLKIGNTLTRNNMKWLIGFDFDNYNVGYEKFSSKLTPSSPLRPDHSNQTLSGFTQLSYISDNFTANAGLRYNYITYTLDANSFLKNEQQSSNYSNLNPTIGFKYKAASNLNIHTSLGTAFYVPDAYKTAGKYTIGNNIYIGNKNLKPESAVSYDIGANYSLARSLSVDLSYFQTFYKNRIISDFSKNDTITYKNALTGMMNGIEVLLSSHISSLWDADYEIDLYGGMTYFFNNEVKDMLVNSAGKEEEVTKDALYTRKTTANFGVSFDNNKGFESRLSGRYIGHRLENDWMVWDNLRPDITPSDYYTKGGYQEDDQILRHSAHLIFDFSSFYTIKKKARIGISFSNLLDENYSEKDGYNMPGRSVMGHFNYVF